MNIDEELPLTIEWAELERRMEEMANEPREELGKRQPGETCAYERPVRHT